MLMPLHAIGRLGVGRNPVTTDNEALFHKFQGLVISIRFRLTMKQSLVGTNLQRIMIFTNDNTMCL